MVGRSRRVVGPPGRADAIHRWPLLKTSYPVSGELGSASAVEEIWTAMAKKRSGEQWREAKLKAGW